MRTKNTYPAPVMMLLALLCLTVNAQAQGSLQAPHHNVTSPSIVGCLDCHDLTASGWPKFIPEPPGYVARNPDALENENTTFNLKCWECHSGSTVISGGAPKSLGNKATHSSLSMGSTRYGEWAAGCTVCHNAHSQGGQPGGKFIWNFARLDQVEVYGGKAAKSGKKTIVFNGPTGPNSFADGDATYNGVCEVCHTETAYHRNNSTGDHAHYAGQHCTNCHSHDSGFKPGTVCLDCHTNSVNARAAIGVQLSGNSHHIQGVALSSNQCYQCHWEADINGEPTMYHTPETSGSAVDLVIRDNNDDTIPDPRPGTYTLGTTALQYMAGTSTALELNPHCLGCHNDDYNNYTTGGGIFGDGKAPNQYAWDGTSVSARYTQIGTTSWGKYSGANITPKNLQTKAFSAHGNAENNEGGWDLAETWTNTRNGSTNVACFDCHNSHGSTVEGITTSYTAATTNGGILKDTAAGKGGYNVDYKPEAGGTENNKNIRNAGASLCLDCHLTADGNENNLPWGYQSSFGASQTIIGYFDSPYLAPGSAGTQLRYPYKALRQNAGGHFGASSPLMGLNGVHDGDEAAHQINGLCASCHDPHGVSPTAVGTCSYTAYVTKSDCLEAGGTWNSTPQLGVPLLKGTWVTSPYMEDVSPANNTKGTVRDNTYPLAYDGIVREGVSYNIDQNTFGANIKATVTGVTHTAQQFAGLCLNCHPKSKLTDGSSGGAWKSVDRIHESVRGWGANNAKHKYTCSKCHAPHNGSSLPRLMVTNCLNPTHKGRTGYNPSPALSGSGSGDENGCYGDAGTLGGCPTYPIDSYNFASGGGGFPGSFDGFYYADHWGANAFTVSCHEGKAADQGWNNVTRWADVTPTITSGPSASMGNQTLLLHMDEATWVGTPGEVTDSSGGNNHGTAYNGAITTAGGISGNAGTFNGTDNYVHVNFAPLQDNFTIEAWIKPTTTHQVDIESTTGTSGTFGQRYLFGADHRGTDGGAGISAGTNGISVYEHGSSYMPALAVYNGALSTSEWNHVAVVYSNKRPSIYLNGVLVRTGLQSPRAHVYAPTRIGGGDYGFFPGMVDDVAIYNTALSADDILLHYQRSSSSVCNSTDAIITWSTDYTATSYVDFGETTDYGLTVGDDTLVKNHSVTLSGLWSPATYHYRVRSFNDDGETLSEDSTFSINVCPPLPPLLASPTATEIGSSSATLGADILNNAGFAITERGTTWGTSPDPSGNILAEGDTATGIYSHLRGTGDGTATPIPAGALVYYRGYATNSSGETGYSPEGSFYTEPAGQASGILFSSVDSTTMTIDWTWDSSDSDGVLVLMKQGSIVDSPPVDGIYTGYSASAEFGASNQIGMGNFVVYKGAGTTVPVTGLSPGTTYYVAIHEYKGEIDTSGVNLGTNYTSAATTGSATTSISPGSYSYTFDYTGTVRPLSIPAGATNIQFIVKGAGGGGGRQDDIGNQENGLPGHMISMSYAITSDVALYIHVGGGGSEGSNTYQGALGGWGYAPGGKGEDGDYYDDYDWAYGGAGGGGSSAIRLDGTTLLTQAAGGEGGKSSDWYESVYSYGGSGGAGGGADYSENTPSAADPAGGGAAGIAGWSPSVGGNGQVVITFDY